MPDCRRELCPTEQAPYVLGEMAHIVAQSTDGPRGDPNLPADQVDGYDNLILLCPTHHRMIDENPAAYPTDVLQRIKAAHEDWVRTALDGAGQPPWFRPRLRFGERWHRVDAPDGGTIQRFGARWLLRVPYQAALVSDPFQTTIDEALERMDAEGPFCTECGVELVEAAGPRGLAWRCEGCGHMIPADRFIEAARAAVVRIGRAPVARVWRARYPRR